MTTIAHCDHLGITAALKAATRACGDVGDALPHDDDPAYEAAMRIYSWGSCVWSANAKVPFREPPAGDVVPVLRGLLREVEAAAPLLAERDRGLVAAAAAAIQAAEVALTAPPSDDLQPGPTT